jgi:hypothetical protein
MNCLPSLGRWDRGFESHSRHGCLCLRLFCVCVVLCVGSGLATGLSLIQGVLPSVKKKMITELKNRPGPSKGCRATGKKKEKIILFTYLVYFLGQGSLDNTNTERTPRYISVLSIGFITCYSVVQKPQKQFTL